MRINEHSPTAYDLLAYLAEHPDAEDTLEGIMEWWLLEQRIKHWTAEVQGALDELVAEGFVLGRPDSAGRTHYRINREKVKDVNALLKRVASEGGKKAAL